MNETKLCSACKVEKSLSEFNKNKSNKDGYSYRCRECVKEHYINNKDAILKSQMEYYYNNKDSKLKYAKHYRDNILDKNKASEYQREYRNKNYKKILEVKNLYYKTEKGKSVLRKCLINARKKHPQKNFARHIINYNIKKGSIIKPKKCQICNKDSEKIHGHHEDYSKPLDVIWCCHKCHIDIHNKRLDDNRLNNYLHLISS